MMSHSALATVRVLNEIVAEREKQKDRYSAAHDDAYKAGEIADGAICYAYEGVERILGDLSDDDTKGFMHEAGLWAWARNEFHPADSARQNLVIAATMLVAEIERLDRIEEKHTKADKLAALKTGYGAGKLAEDAKTFHEARVDRVAESMKHSFKQNGHVIINPSDIPAVDSKELEKKLTEALKREGFAVISFEELSNGAKIVTGDKRTPEEKLLDAIFGTDPSKYHPRPH